MKKIALILMLVIIVTLISIISHAESTSYDYKIEALQIDNSSKKQTSPYQFCADKDYKIPIQLTNPGDVSNKYFISAEGKYASVPGDFIIVKKGKVKDFFVNYSPLKEGEYDVIVKSKTKYGDEKEKIRLPIKVDNCYDVRIDIPSEIKVDSSQMSFPVRNEGTKEAELELGLEDNRYVGLEDKELNISEEDSITFNVLKPDYTGVKNIELHKDVNGIKESRNLKFIFGEPFLYKYKNHILIGVALLIIICSLFYLLIRKMPKKSKKSSKKQAKAKVERESRPVRRVKKEVNRKTEKNIFIPVLLGLMVIIIASIASSILYLNISILSIWNEIIKLVEDNIVSFYIVIVILLIILLYLLLKKPKSDHYMSQI